MTDGGRRNEWRAGREPPEPRHRGARSVQSVLWIPFTQFSHRPVLFRIQQTQYGHGVVILLLLLKRHIPLLPLLHLVEYRLLHGIGKSLNQAKHYAFDPALIN